MAEEDMKAKAALANQQAEAKAKHAKDYAEWKAERVMKGTQGKDSEAVALEAKDFIARKYPQRRRPNCRRGPKEGIYGH